MSVSSRCYSSGGPYTNRNVFPRTYSLGACRSKRMALLLSSQYHLCQLANVSSYQTKIHSCRSFPCASCFGHTSKKKYMSFFSGFDLLGMTNRMICMRRPVCGSPLSIMERIFFCEVVRPPTQGTRGSAMARAHHSLNLLLIIALFQSVLELVLGRDIGGIVLVYLLSGQLPVASPSTATYCIQDCTSSRGMSPCWKCCSDVS
jgi:hypothetical protein